MPNSKKVAKQPSDKYLKKNYFAPGIKEKNKFGDLDKIKTKQVLDFIIQGHNARIAKLHKDIRIGNKELDLYSWATRKPLPELGKSIGIFRTNRHDYAYKDFEGTIPLNRYGGGSVWKEHEGKILITKHKDQNIHFTTGSSSVPNRYAIIHPEERGFRRALLVRANTPSDPGVEKPKFKPVEISKIVDYLKSIGKHDLVQPKLDGALALVHFVKNDNLEVLSHRTSKRTGKPEFQTERFFQYRPEVHLPKELRDTVLMGEMYATKDGKHIPLQELGGILNSAIAKSVEDQKSKNIEMKMMLFDIARKGKQSLSDLPYEERLKVLGELFHKLPNQEQFHLPETVKGPKAAIKMLKKIQGGKHPLTTEGLIVRHQDGTTAKAKLVDEQDVFIRNIFAGEGKYQGKAAGGFSYSLVPNGPAVGKVGTGLDDITRKMLFDDPAKFIGRTARIHTQGQYPTGAYRSPSFISLHESK